MRRTVEASTRGLSLYLKQSQLVVSMNDEVLDRIPFEDIGVLILGSTGVTVSSGVFKAIADAGGAILSCDDKFKPSGLFLPLHGNGLHSERLRFQSDASVPLKKNIWAKIVTAKITNQAHLLAGSPKQFGMFNIASRVKSGDSTRKESQAARIYWSEIFSKYTLENDSSFTRHRYGATPNNLLNYGYAVLRTATARALCCAGLHPVIGVHHRNRYSEFCLADDVMEPYRPFVDKAVLGLIENGEFEITKETKVKLIEVLQHTVKTGTGTGPLAHSLERCASSLAACFEKSSKDKLPVNESVKSLLLPEWQEKRN